MSFSVVILSKLASNLIPCVRAVQRNEPDLAATRIIVVNDGARAEAEEEIPGIWWTEGEKPFVFARNANRGIQIAEPDDVVLLNDDAILETPGGLTRLAQATEAHPGYGLFAATCNNVGNPNQFRLNGGGIHGAGIRGGLLEGLRDEPRMVCFVCVYIPRRTIELIGLLDESFIGYGCEDDDYCLRVRRAGLKIGILDSCYVDHGSLRSSFRGAAGAGGDFRPNLQRFIQKWGVDNWGRPRETSQFRELFA